MNPNSGQFNGLQMGMNMGGMPQMGGGQLQPQPGQHGQLNMSMNMGGMGMGVANPMGMGNVGQMNSMGMPGMGMQPGQQQQAMTGGIGLNPAMSAALQQQQQQQHQQRMAAGGGVSMPGTVPAQAIQMLLQNPAKLQQLAMRIRQMRAAGVTPETNTELAQLMRLLHTVGAAQRSLAGANPNTANPAGGAVATLSGGMMQNNSMQSHLADPSQMQAQSLAQHSPVNAGGMPHPSAPMMNGTQGHAPGAQLNNLGNAHLNSGVGGLPNAAMSNVIAGGFPNAALSTPGGGAYQPTSTLSNATSMFALAHANAANHNAIHAPSPSPSPPITFTDNQLLALRAQIQAYRMISRGLPIPEHLATSIKPMPVGGAVLNPVSAAGAIAGGTIASSPIPAAAGSTATSSVTATMAATAASAVAGVPAVRATPAAPPREQYFFEQNPEWMEWDQNSKVWPYNSYVDPWSLLSSDQPPKDDSSTAPSSDTTTAVSSALAQALAKFGKFIPSVMPWGLDPHQILAAQQRFVEARIEARIGELSLLPSSIGEGLMEGMAGGLNALGQHARIEGVKETKMNGVVENGGSSKSASPSANVSGSPAANGIKPTATTTPSGPPIVVDGPGKLRALIELKSLQLRHKQRALRLSVTTQLAHASLLPTDRREYRRVRVPRLRDARETESLERQQREERERKSKQKHLDYLGVIFRRGEQMIEGCRDKVASAQRFGRSVGRFHADTEKEEAERVKRISKERLKALKAGDERAYEALLDAAKDTRITHLLRQTDTYLDSLSNTILAQQRDEEGKYGTVGPAEDESFDERAFGGTRMEDDTTAEEKKLDYYAVAHRIQEKVTQQPSMLIGGQLKEYQIKGLQWMVSLYNNRLNGILADEMGLGKTIQTISLIGFLIEKKQQRGPYLVIVPLSTLTNWTLEFSKWAPSMSVIAYKGTANVRKQLQNSLRPGAFQVLVTTYEYIIKDRPVLSKIKWVHMIIDEGHRMKNSQSKLSQTLSQYYHSRHRLILTGTPLQNNLPELWSLLNFVLPRVFNSAKSFDDWFNTPFANTGGADKIALNEEESLLIIRRLHKVLRPFLLRRLKKDVAADLPDKIERVIKCRMSALQTRVYKQYTDHRMIFGEGKDDKNEAGEGLHNDLMQFRKICQHPFLFPKIENALDSHCPDMLNIIRAAGKFELLDRILPKLFGTGHRCLIFFQMTNVMDLMDHFMNIRGWKFLRLDGTSKQENRAEDVAKFNAPNSDVQAFLLSTRAGGLGLNLQTADTVIIFDSDWNPHADLQAQDRAHRIGQTKAVRVYRLITEKSIEEAILARAREKLSMDGKVIQAGKFDNKSTAQEREEMLRSLIGGDQEDTEESGIMNDDELNEILARDDSEGNTFRRMDEEREREEERAWRAAGGTGVRRTGLMAFEELPPVYQTDNPASANRGNVDEGPTGRGHRRRAVVNYDIDLTDAQFFESIEAGIAADDEDPPPRTRRRSLSADGEREPTPRGRKAKQKAKQRVDDDFDDAVVVSGKRKRAPPPQRVSVTPSLDDEDGGRDQKRRKIQPMPSSTDLANGITPQIRERMKKVFAECLKAVQACEDETGRQRCALFRELPKRADYPDYYTLIQTPIAMSHMRKRGTTSYYKSVIDYRNDWRLMFDNARTYNSEGSWVYNDAVEMQKVLEEAFQRLTYGTNLPGAEGAGSGGVEAPSSSSSAVPMITQASMQTTFAANDDDDAGGSGGGARRKPKRTTSRVKKVLSDDDDDDYLSGGSSD